MAPKASDANIADLPDLESARILLRGLVRAGTAAFAAFVVCDLYSGLVAIPRAELPWLLWLRGFGSVWLLAMCFVAELPLAEAGIRRCAALAFGGGAAIISAMAIGYGGLTSPYLHGVSLVVLYNATGLPLPWRKALVVTIGITLSFPLVLLLAIPFSRFIREQWQDARVVFEFGQHYIFVLGTASLGSVTSHLVWSARRQAALEEAARARLFVNLSHDFRTPLGVIQGEAELLESGPRSLTERAAIKRIQKNAAALADLCDQLLALARLDVGRTPIDRTCFDLVELTRSVVASIEQGTPSARIEVVAASEFVVEADVGHVRRILVNLVNHALRHGGDAERRVRIQVRTSPLAEVIEVDVSDNADAISEERRGTVFERFATFDRQGSTASGIGMALARELSRLNAGELEHVVSAPETTFRLTLPPGSGEPTALPAFSAVEVGGFASGPAAPPTLKAPRVLIVEDNDDMADLLRRILASNFLVERVSSIAAGKQWLARSVAAAVICDVMLPDGSGYDLLHWLKRTAGRMEAPAVTVPVLMVSALGEARERVRGLEAGADDYLAKPFSSGELLARVSGLVHRHVARQRELERQRSDLLMEVHDGVSASLSRALLQLTASTPTPETSARARQAQASIRDGLQEMRAMTSLLSARATLWSELIAELRSEVARSCEEAHLRFTFQADDGLDQVLLSGTLAHDIRRIAREALTNVIRHAGATNVRCEVERRGGQLRLCIQDDGKGYPAEPRGRGTTIMKRRAERCNGSLRIKGSARGSSVELLVPIRASELPGRTGSD